MGLPGRLRRPPRRLRFGLLRRRHPHPALAHGLHVPLRAPHQRVQALRRKEGARSLQDPQLAPLHRRPHRRYLRRCAPRLSAAVAAAPDCQRRRRYSSHTPVLSTTTTLPTTSHHSLFAVYMFSAMPSISLSSSSSSSSLRIKAISTK